MARGARPFLPATLIPDIIVSYECLPHYTILTHVIIPKNVMDMVVSDYDPPDIVDWVDALSLDTDPDRRGFIAPSFARKCFRGISDSDWQKLLKHGLLDVLLDMLCRDDMGGRKWETLADDEYFEKDLVVSVFVTYTELRHLTTSTYYTYLAAYHGFTNDFRQCACVFGRRSGLSDGSSGGH